MNTYTFIIVIILMFCFLMCFFIKESLKVNGKMEFEGRFELFKLFKFKFKAKYDNNKK